jgi:RHS repeat-associated protein
MDFAKRCVCRTSTRSEPQIRPLYRVTEAKEASNSTQTWKQIFGYDRYGNRTTHEKYIGTTQQTLDAVTHPAIDNTKNRFSTGQGYTFDENGNIVVDAQGRQFVFNGDNKQTEVKDASNNVIGEYFYDGEGKRIKKVAGDQTTIFVYSGAKLIAEYSTETPPQNPTTSYTITDQLGSPRIIVNSLGEVVSRRDFMPFGEELEADGTYRTTTQKYGQPDRVRQRFTGYQKDEETGLDFAEARMYQNLHGRFTVVDPLLASGKSADPQTFNRYVYVLNNPLILTDPSGLQAGDYAGTVYTDGTRYSNVPGDDSWRPFTGDITYTASDGYTYRVVGSGWTQLGDPPSTMLLNALSDTGIGAAQFGWNSMAFVSNSFYRALEQPSPFAGSWNESMIIHRTPYWEAENQTQANAQLAMTGVSLFWGLAGAATRTATTSSGGTIRAIPSADEIVGSGNAYSVAFETRLSSSSYPGLTRAQHFQEANRNLFNAMEADTQFNTQMNTLIPGIQQQLRSTNGAFSPRSPANWTWHHAQRPGVMQLVPRAQHRAPGPIQRLLHPNGIGGFKIWGQ